jgi:hypothetical protein
MELQNGFTRWTEKEIKLLIDSLDKGIPLTRVSKALGRSLKSVEGKVYRMGKRSGVEMSAPEVKSTVSGGLKSNAKDFTKVAREIARRNGKRITMAMFFVEDLD